MERLLEKIGKAVFFLLLVNAHGIFAQKVTLSADDTRIAPGDPVTITLSTDVNGEAKIDLPMDFTPDNGTSEGMESVMDHITGKVRTSYFIQQRGVFSKKGKYTFYGFVRYKGRNIRSNSVTITVDEDALDNVKAPRVKDPIYGIIQASKTVVYEGEPLLMRAKVFSTLDIYHLEGYNPFHIENNAEEHLFQDQLPNFRREKVNGKQLLTLEFGNQLVFPVKTGKSRVTPFEIAFLFHDNFIDRSVSLKSSPLVITVKPLPNGTPADFIGAVGNYSLSMQTGKTALAEGEIFELTLKVKGLGNLHNTNAPVLNLPNGCTVYGDPERTDDYIFTESGVEGEITYKYNIAIAKTGKISFGAQSISYFDLGTEKYRTAYTEPFEIEVKPSQNASAAPKGVKPKPAKQQPAIVAKTAQRSYAWIVFIIGGIAVIAATFFFLRKKPGEQESAEEIPAPDTPVSPLNAVRDYWKELEETASNDAIADLLPKAITAEINRKTGKNFLLASEALRNAGDLSGGLSEIVEACEHYKYSFGEKSLDGKELVQKARKLLRLTP